MKQAMTRTTGEINNVTCSHIELYTPLDIDVTYYNGIRACWRGIKTTAKTNTSAVHEKGDSGFPSEILAIARAA
jgi:hypothetical protein